MILSALWYATTAPLRIGMSAAAAAVRAPILIVRGVVWAAVAIIGVLVAARLPGMAARGLCVLALERDDTFSGVCTDPHGREAVCFGVPMPMTGIAGIVVLCIVGKAVALSLPRAMPEVAWIRSAASVVGWAAVIVFVTALAGDARIASYTFCLWYAYVVVIAIVVPVLGLGGTAAVKKRRKKA